MKLFLSILTFNVITSCGTQIIEVPIEEPIYTAEEYATYFIVVADTGSSYVQLDKKMITLSEKLHVEIDRMGRSHNEEKNLIALPEDDEDEIYAGDYFPRRYPSECFSLEYLNFYKDDAGDKTIAIVAGIFEVEKSAEKFLRILKKEESNAILFKTKIYTGCIH